MSGSASAPLLANHIPLSELAERAHKLLSEGARGETDEVRAKYVDNWLKWSQDDSPETRRRWSHLIQSKEIDDRDHYVLALWKSIHREGSPNQILKAYFEDYLGPWDFYRRHFFAWFLSRFNLRAAREVLPGTQLAAGLPYGLALVTLCLVAWALSGGVDLSRSVLALVWIVILMLLGKVVSKLPAYAYIHSLIPRMAAAIGIGYLFLVSAPHLVKLILTHRHPALQFLIAFGLVAASLAYIILHIWRRVFPPLSVRSLLARSFEVLVLAIAYAGVELLLLAPLFYVPAFLGIEAKDIPAAQASHLVLCAAIALNLGVILQLAWDEKPLTEPL